MENNNHVARRRAVTPPHTPASPGGAAPRRLPLRTRCGVPAAGMSPLAVRDGALDDFPELEADLDSWRCTCSMRANEASTESTPESKPAAPAPGTAVLACRAALAVQLGGDCGAVLGWRAMLAAAANGEGPAAVLGWRAMPAAANGEASAAPPGCWAGAAAKGEGPMLGCRIGAAAAKGDAPAASLGCRTGAAAKGEAAAALLGCRTGAAANGDAAAASLGCRTGAAANGDASAAASNGDAPLPLLWPALLPSAAWQPLAAATWAARPGASSTGPET